MTFHYLNRMVTVFLGDSPVPDGTPAPARRGVLRVLGRLFRERAGARYPPGASLPLLPAGPAPPESEFRESGFRESGFRESEFPWASASPTVSDALARAYATFDSVGAEHVATPVRDLVTTAVRSWDGTTDLSVRADIEHAITPLAVRHRTAARLALLTALAPHRVDGSVVAAYREQHPTDLELVSLTSWASATAARGVGRWLGPSTAL